MAPWKQGDHFSTALYHRNKFGCSKNWKYKRLTHEFRFSFDVEKGYYDRVPDLEVVFGRNSPTEFLFPMEDINEVVYEKIGKWLLLGEKFKK
ncbi:MAG: hypothetical protein ACKVRN_04115 [Pyrinomonadaceae bacterium]